MKTDIKNRVKSRYEAFKDTTGLDGFEIGIYTATAVGTVAIGVLAVNAAKHAAAYAQAEQAWILDQNNSGRAVMNLSSGQVVSAPASKINYFEF